MANPFVFNGQLPDYDQSIGRFDSVNGNDSTWPKPEVNPFAQQQQDYWASKPLPQVNPFDQTQAAREVAAQRLYGGVRRGQQMPTADTALPQLRPYLMEPDLFSRSLGAPVPEGSYLSDSGIVVDRDFNPIPMARRPNVLPITRNPETREFEWAMPKAMDILGLQTATLGIPPGTATLGSGMIRGKGSAPPLQSIYEALDYTPQDISRAQIVGYARAKDKMRGRPPSPEQIEDEIRSLAMEEGWSPDIGTPSSVERGVNWSDPKNFEALIGAVKEGRSPQEIADMFGTTAGAVLAKLSRLRSNEPEILAGAPKLKHSATIFDDETVNEIRELKSQGLNNKAIAERKGLNENSIAAILSQRKQQEATKIKELPSQDWESDLQKELIGQYHYLLQPENNPLFKAELNAARAVKKSTGERFTETGGNSDYFKIWDKYQRQVRRFLNLPKGALTEAIGPERAKLAAAIQRDEGMGLQKEFSDFVNNSKKRLSVTDSPGYQQELKALTNSAEGAIPDDKLWNLYIKHYLRYKAFAKKHGYVVPYDKPIPESHEDGGRVGYAEGGAVASPFDLGAMPINDAQSPFDLGAQPVDENWRGYPTVIGSGIAQGAITGVGKTLQGIPELYADKPQETALARAGRAIEQYGIEKFPLKPEEQKSISGQVATSLGTVAPIIGGGGAGALLGAGRAAGVIGTLAGAGQMGLMGSAEQGQRAREKGASPETARQAAIAGAGVNTALGLIPFGVIFKPITRASPEITAYMVAKLKAAAESGVVFAGVGEAQHWLGEEIAKEFYDPQAGYHPDAERAMVGLLSGAVLGGTRRVPRTEPERPVAPGEPIDESRPRPQEPIQQVDQLLAGETLANQVQRQGAQLRALQERPTEPANTDTLFPERREQTPTTDTLFPERAEKSSETTAAPLPPITTVRPTELKVDPRYQFRMANEKGLTESPSVQKIEAFDPAKANPILAHETTDGNINVVNGFHRTELARQTEAPLNARILREADGYSPEFMKRVGVYQNLAEGTGGVEAARILRANPQGVIDRLGTIPESNRIVQDANALARLSPEGFGLVSKGQLPAAYAAEVARLVRDQVNQTKALEAISRAKPENIDQVRQIAREFEPLGPERQQVLNRAIEALEKSSQSNQAERASNERLAQTLQIEASRQGEIAKALTDAAKQLSSGRPISAVAPSFVARARPLARRQLEGVQQRVASDSGRPAEEGAALPSVSPEHAARTAEPLPSLTPAAKAKRKQIESALTSLIEQQIGKHVKIKFSNKIPIQNVGEYGGKFAEEKTAAGMYWPAERIIELAMADKRYPDVARAALHEPFHVVQDLLATPAELKILKREDGRLREIAAKELGLSPEQARNISTVEVQAAAYDAWARGQIRGQELPSPVRQLYNRVRDFLRKVGNAMRGLGFKSADDIFQSTFSGEMASREAREPGRFVEQARGVPSFPSVAPATAPAVKPPQPTDTLGPVAKKFSDLIDKIGLGDVARDIQIKLTPGAARDSTIESRAAAKDFANGIREAKWTRSKLDEWIDKNFTRDEQKRMWEAADAESVALQTGQPTNKGLSSLTTKEREAVQRLQARADEVFDEAKRLGIYEGDEKLPSYVTRLILMKKGEGQYERPNFNKIRSLDSIGGKLRTTTAQMIERKYLTVEETEAAAKEKLGPEAEVLRNIRVLPYATGLLQEAIAGRKLIERIKEAGKEANSPTVAEGEKPQGNWFTIDHPAFYNTRETPDGTVQRTPIYVRGDFEGPLRSVLEQNNGSKIYQGLMNLKGKTMSVIMMSPLIHNQVEFGRALPAMPGKVVTGRIYFEGNTAKNDPAVMREAIRAGLAPIGHRGFLQDISSVQEAPNLNPGRSTTAKILAAVPNLFSKYAGDAVKRTVDRMGDFWHNTLLWDRIGDLQMGLYTNLRDHLIQKGYSPLTAQRAAAHWANRYAGAIPIEAMSANARKIANLLMFSRSFTLGNLGVIKDSYTGLPRDIQAQIARDSGMKELAKIKGLARRKATAVLIIDIGLFYVMNSLLQSAIQTAGVGQTSATLGGALAGGALGSALGGPFGAAAGAIAGGVGGFNATTSTGDRTLDEEIQGYKDRFANLMKRAKENPFEVFNPLAMGKTLGNLSSTSENEPDKQERVLAGYQSDGTAIYAKPATGKLGEEMMGWTQLPTGPLDMMHRKLSTWAKPLSEIWANNTGFGDPIYYKHSETMKDDIKNAGRMVWHLMKAQVPGDWIQSLADLESSHGDKTTNLLKAIGPIAGLTFSRGAPSGPAYGDILRQKEQQRFELSQNRDTIRRLVVDGKIQEATDLMLGMKMESKEITNFIRMYTPIEGGGNRVSGRAAKKFTYQATPEEIEAFRRHQQRQPAPPSSPFDLGAQPRP